MLSRILKDNGLLSLLLVVVGAIALIMVRMVDGSGVSTVTDQLAAHWAFRWMGPWLLAKQLFCAMMVLLAGFLTRTIGIRFKLLESKGWLPILVMVCMALLFQHLLVRPDLMLALVIGQAVVALILSTYKQDSVLTTLFHVGMLSGVAAILHGQSIVLLLVVLFSIFIMRPGAWREWIMPIAGVAMILIFLMLVLIWQAEPFSALRQVLLSAWIFPIGAPSAKAGHIIMLVLIGLSLPSVMQEMSSGAVRTRNGMLVVVSLVVVALLSAIGLGLSWTEAAAMAAFPSAVLISAMMEKIKVWWWADLLIIAMTAAVFLV
jgi:hypothetical protein